LNKGRKIGAFFDLDGTVIAPPSLEWRFATHLARNRELRASAIARWLGLFLKDGLKSLYSDTDLPTRLAAVDRNKAYLAGVRVSAAQNWAAHHAKSLEFFPDAIRRIAWHREKGHEIFFVSGTLAPLAHVAATHLGVAAESSVAASELVELEGRWTGNVAGEAVSGPAKALSMQRLAAIHHIELAHSFAYGNSFADRWFLAAVGNAVAINPGSALAALARTSGWPILRWARIEPYAESNPRGTRHPSLSRGKLSWK
jgi:HAD superfamily hydrolase (TIGR01490 family)